jgi:RNA polymerase sigma factor (TIGR02999 family)
MLYSPQSAGTLKKEIDVTALLHAWAGGDDSVLQQLTPLVYPELKRLARYQLHSRRSQTLQPTALVHEVWLRLAAQNKMDARSRVHFLSLAANLMRQILVDHARAASASKRGGGALRVPMQDDHLTDDGRNFLDFLALNAALESLARFDPRKARIVELRFFAGLTGEEIASLLGIGTATVSRDLQLAQAWLKREMGSQSA